MELSRDADRVHLVRASDVGGVMLERKVGAERLHTLLKMLQYISVL